MEEPEEEQSQKQFSDDQPQPDSETEQSQANQELNVKKWRSNLIKDGLGPFLQPQKLKDKVLQISLRSGLAD